MEMISQLHAPAALNLVPPHSQSEFWR